MNVRCRVELSQSERAELMRLMSGGKQAAQGVAVASEACSPASTTRPSGGAARGSRPQAQASPDPAGRRRRRSDEDIAASVGVGASTVYRAKRLFVEGNLERALSEELTGGGSRAGRDRRLEPACRARALDVKVAT